MANYDLVFSFGVDNGELDGFTPAQCFTLGFELAQIDYAIGRSLRPQSIGFHVGNVDRIERLMKERHKDRKFSLKWAEGDVSESWMVLIVEDGSSCSERSLDDEPEL